LTLFRQRFLPAVSLRVENAVVSISHRATRVMTSSPLLLRFCVFVRIGKSSVFFPSLQGVPPRTFPQILKRASDGPLVISARTVVLP